MKFLAKTALPLLAALAFTFSASSAQTAPPPQDPSHHGKHAPRSPQDMAQHQTQRLAKELNLSADQSARVQQIMQQRAQDMQAMRTQAPAGADRQQLHEQMKANRDKYDAQLKGVLTPEQFGKYAALREEHRHRGFEGKDGKFKAKDGDRKFKAKTSQS